MSKAKQCKSETSTAIHETASSLYQIGAIDKKTMRGFDETCLEPIPEMAPETIKELRTREQVSQPVFAIYLNVSKNLVSDWERGVKNPSGPSLRLLSIVQKYGLDALI